VVQEAIDHAKSVLYEAKSTADRLIVQLALGQLLDYQRFFVTEDVAVLLAEAPTADLVELLEFWDLGCVVETPTGYVDMTSLGRCP
jgi:hypothetical protein